MADLNKQLETNLANLRQFIALPSPTNAQMQTALKVVCQSVCMLIFTLLNHPDDVP